MLSLVLGSAPALADGVDEYLRTAIREQHIPGLALAVVRDGKVVKTAGYGSANLELGVPVTPATVFEIGSVTKQFTAAAILLLVEEGKVSLDDPIGRHLGGVPPAWRRITVQHLLTHQSGIPDYLGASAVLRAFHPDIAHEEVARLLFEGLTLEFEPGETWSYSNSAYLLLGNIIEKASAKTYWQFLDERIFGPLSMTATRSSAPRVVVPGRASGYEWTKDAFRNRPALGEDAYAAGAIVSTVGDLARWDAALRGTSLLSRDSLRQMWMRHTLADGAIAPFDYGFGWFLGTHHGRAVVAHTGGTPGFSSALYRFVDDGLTVILLTNHTDRVLDHLAMDVAAMYVPALEAASPSADPDPRLTATLRTALLGAIERKPDLALFTHAMQRFLQTGVGRDLWAWTAADGPIESLTFSESERDGNDRILRYRTVVGGVKRWYSFKVTPEGRIAQIRWW